MGIINRFGRIALLVALLSLVAAATAATGTIQITVHPGSGTICLDTVCRENAGTVNETGSTTFENVEAGVYHMLNVYGVGGYKPWLGQVYLDPSGTSLTREIYLEPLPPSAPETGTVRIFITPDGGKVCLDRMCEGSSGDRTGSWNVQFTSVAANTFHNLTISTEGYETWSTQVRVLPGQTSTMYVTLQPLPFGSTPSSTPVPTTEPQPSPILDLPALIALVAAGIGGIAWVFRQR